MKLVNANKLVRAIRNGELHYHFVEVMACPGGCLGGGGQPYPVSWEVRQMRAQGIYEEDKNLLFRKSHENPEIMQIYEEYLGQPNSHKAHELLHTHYYPRKKYIN